MSTDPAGMTKTAADTADEYIEACAQIYDTCLFPGLGDVLRDAWREIRALVVPPHCDCPLDPHHRWNCALTPVRAQTIRELDTNPWTVVANVLDQCPMPTECPICGSVDWSKFLVPQYDDPICIECWQCNRHKEPDLWHCAECGKFLRGLDRCVLWQPPETTTFLCLEHLDAEDYS